MPNPYINGLKMTKEAVASPEHNKMRVVVAYNSKGTTDPYCFVLHGNLDHENEHQIRYAYNKATKCLYRDTRVVLYKTYIKRSLENKKKLVNI